MKEQSIEQIFNTYHKLHDIITKSQPIMFTYYYNSEFSRVHYTLSKRYYNIILILNRKTKSTNQGSTK